FLTKHNPSAARDDRHAVCQQRIHLQGHSSLPTSNRQNCLRSLQLATTHCKLLSRLPHERIHPIFHATIPVLSTGSNSRLWPCRQEEAMSTLSGIRHTIGIGSLALV